MPTKILVVDDEPDLELLIHQKFRREMRAGELSFSYAANGLEALAAVGRDPDIELVLSDINMPEMDGLALLGRLRTLRPSLQTIVISAYGDMENIRAAMNRGAFDFLTKPIDFEDLKITVRKTLSYIGELKKLARAEKEKRDAEKRALEEEQKARKAQQQMIAHLHKMDQLKDQFLANTSHELRTPISGIIGIAESLMSNGKNMDEAARVSLAMVVDSGRRLTSLVDDILDFSKMESGDLNMDIKPLNLSQAIQSVLALCYPLVEGRPVTLECKITDQLPTILADPNRLQQILFNLLGNAIKFTKTGSISISAQTLEKEVEVTVSDTGIGIPEDRLDEIFSSFRQLENSATRIHGGVGLGLAITRKLVEMNGGLITVDSVLEKGSHFHFTLPITDKPPMDTADLAKTHFKVFVADETAVAFEPLTPEKIIKKDGHNILAVDDEPINRQVLHNLLDQFQARVESSGEAALTAIEEEDFDIVILDLMMPGMSGLEVCRKIRAKKSLYELPVLMLTARTQVKDYVAGFDAGVNDYLTKPFDRRELFARIHTLLSLKDAVASAISHQQELREEQLRAEVLKKEKTVLAYRAEESARAEAQALEVSRQKTDFLALMSHELRTPLNAIIGYSEILHEDMTDEKLNHLIPDITKIQTSARNLLIMINNLLDLTRIEAGKMDLFLEDFRLSLLFEEVETTIQPIAAKSENRLIFRIEEGLNYIHADITKLRQVLLNLLGNSCKFTRAGTITVAAHGIEQNGSPKILISVQDTGIGIHPENLSRLFRPYTQAEKSTSRHYGGSGLGLTICKRFCELMNGEISVESVLNEGTTVFLTLPRP